MWQMLADRFSAIYLGLTGARFSLAHLRRRLLEMTAAEAGMMFLLMLFIQSGSWMLWGGVVLLFEATRRYISVSILLQMGAVYALAYLIGGIYAWHVWHRRHVLDGERIATFCLIYYFTVMIYAASMSGIFAIAVGVIAIGMPVIGMVFIPARIVVRSMVYGITLLLVLGVLTALNKLAYAPMYNMEYRIGRDAGFSLFYVISQLYIALPMIAMLIASVGMVFVEWRRREGEMVEVSRHDSLTGLYNRRAANERIEWLLGRPAGYVMSVVLVDLDHFKRINDVHGHLTGDRALRVAAMELKSQLRESDMLARIGGEEFIIVLADAHMQQAVEVAERCRQRLATKVVWNSELEPVMLSASFGVATAVAGDHYTLTDLLHMADECLYKAKDQGRNRVVARPGFAFETRLPPAGEPI